MTDKLWEQLDFEKDAGWSGSYSISFGGREYEVELLIQAEDDQTGITDRQKQSVVSFSERWRDVEPLLVDALIKYYNHEEKNSYGPENKEEAVLWWPDIATYEELVNAVTPETIVIPPDYLMESNRRVYLLFGRSWGGEDLDDNGIGVCLIDEKITGIGYKDIAF